MPSWKNWNVLFTICLSIAKNCGADSGGMGWYQALHRLANGTKGNRSTATINHNRSTVGGGGVGGAVIVITEILHYVVLCGYERKNMLD